MIGARGSALACGAFACLWAGCGAGDKATVTVENYDGGKIELVSTAVDGTQVDEVETTNDVATDVAVDPSGALTIVWLPPGAEGGSKGRLFTYLEVQPGDELVVRNQNVHDGDEHDLQVSWPEHGNAYVYLELDSCSPNGPRQVTAGPITVPLWDSCVANGKADVQIVGIDQSDKPFEWATISAPIDAGSAAVTAWHAPVQLHLTASTSTARTLGGMWAAPVLDETSIGETDFAPAANGNVDTTVTWAPGVDSLVGAWYALGTGTGGVVEHLPPSASAWTLDDATVPAIDGYSFDGGARWNEGAGLVPDVAQCTSVWSVGDIAVTWNVIGPDRGKLPLPALPADLAGLDQVRTLQPWDSQIMLLHHDEHPSYRDAIQGPEWEMFGPATRHGVHWSRTEFKP